MAKKRFYLMLFLPKKTMTYKTIIVFYLDMLAQPLVKYEKPVYVAFFIVVVQKMAQVTLRFLPRVRKSS